MADQSAVVIRDEAGTEHEFPPGFDPKRAAEIVRQQATPRDARGVPLDAPRDARGQIITSHDEEPTALEQMLGPLAHPQTLTDFARLLTVPVDSIRKAAASALTMAAGRSSVGDAATAVKNLASRVRFDPAAAADGFSLTKPQGVLKGLSLAPKTPEMTAPGYDRYLPNQSGYVPPPVEPVPAPSAAAPAPPTEFQAAQAARANSFPDQKALNEAALAARRAAYQASQAGAAAEPIVAASGKMQLTAAEMKEFTRLVSRGMKLPDALEAVKAARELAARFGSPTSAQVAADMASRRYKS